MSQNAPELSVVTVVLNDLGGLERAIKSVQRQVSISIEMIIVDGGSIDGSAELAAKHSSVLIDSKSDGGIYPAMQRGAASASGEYLIFCNSGDEFFGSEFLTKAITELRDSNSNWGFGPILERTLRNSYAWVPAIEDASSRSIIYREIFVPFPSFIIKRDFYNKIGGLTSDYKIAGDFELICKAALASNPLVFKEPIALFFAGGVSYTRADLAWREEIKIRTKLLSLSLITQSREWIKYLMRISRWKIGKVLDKVQATFFKDFQSWRNMRAIEVPTKYNQFLTK